MNYRKFVLNIPLFVKQRDEIWYNHHDSKWVFTHSEKNGT